MKKILLLQLLVLFNQFICFSANKVVKQPIDVTCEHDCKLDVFQEKRMKTLEKGQLFSKQVVSTNSIYVINNVFDLKGATVTIPQDCKLVFNGGGISNGIIKMNKTSLEASEGDVIFKNCSFSGTITNTQLYPAWFGAEIGSDLSETLPVVMRAAYSLGVKTIHFSSGVYYVKNELRIGGDKYNEWNINILGNGNSVVGGTVFSYSGKGKIIVDQRADIGLERSFNISDVFFEGTENRSLTALVLKQSYCGSIQRCMFRNFDYCIKLTGLSYLNNIESCLFRQSHNGVAIINTTTDVDYAPGQANNNFINYCHFVYCDKKPVDFQGANGCVISDSNIEGGNGCAFIGSNNTIRNVRFERNIETVPWIIAQDNCSIDAQVFSINKGSEWKVVLEGNNNRVNMSFDNGQNYLGIVSYGRGSCFRISTQSKTFNTGFVFDPDDEFIINGFSNKGIMTEENLIKTFNGMEYGNGYINYKGVKYKEITSKSRIVKSTLAKNTKSYLTMKFYAKDSNKESISGLGVLGSQLPIKSIDKWYQLVVYSKDAGLGKDFNILVCDFPTSTKVAIAEVAVSVAPLFNVSTTNLNARGTGL